jgi:hypothetical protein
MPSSVHNCVGFTTPLSARLFVTVLDLAKSFGKRAGWGVGLAFLGPVFMPILSVHADPRVRLRALSGSISRRHGERTDRRDGPGRLVSRPV